MSSVPNNTTFCFSDVIAAVVPPTNDLVSAINAAVVCGGFDPTYGGSCNSLLNFRNWTTPTTTTTTLPPTTTTTTTTTLPPPTVKSINIEVCDYCSTANYSCVYAMIVSTPPLGLDDCFCIDFCMKAEADGSDSGAYADSSIINPNPFTLCANAGNNCGISHSVSGGLGDDYCVGISACTVNGIGLSRGRLEIVGVGCLSGSASCFQIGITCISIDVQAPSM